jgi:hypothetical protein
MIRDGVNTRLYKSEDSQMMTMGSGPISEPQGRPDLPNCRQNF